VISHQLLSGLPLGLRHPLLSTYREITSNFTQHRWEPAELNGGKFCEIVYTIVQGALVGTYPDKPQKPTNMREACISLERMAADPNRVGDRSLRILIPRKLPVLYEIRNNRGVGRVGGDVNPNHMDATAVHSLASWILAELVRIYHSVSTSAAQEVVEALSERKTPLIWEFDGTRRVLDSKLSSQDQVLLLLHRSVGWVEQEKLQDWVEYKAKSMFAVRVLLPLHKLRLIEYDQTRRQARISPTGVERVEVNFLERH
jgi:hypothetical protein